MDWVGPPPVASGFYCEICDLTFTDQRNFNLHRADRMHLQKCYQMEYNMNQPDSFAPDARQLLALYSNENTGNVASTPASFHSLEDLHGPAGRGIRKRFCESTSSNFNIRYQPQSSVSASPQTSSKRQKLADKPTTQNHELASPSLSLSPSSSIGSNVCSVSEKKLAAASTALKNSMERVGHTNNTLKDTLSKIKSLMGSLEKYKLLPKSTAIAASLDLNVLDEKLGQRIGTPNEALKLSKIETNHKLPLMADGTSLNVSVNNLESLGKTCLGAKRIISSDCNQVPHETIPRLSPGSVAATSLIATSSGNLLRNVLANQLSASFISPKNETSRSMAISSSTDPIPNTLIQSLAESPSTADTVNKLQGKSSLNIFEKFSADCQKNKTATSSPVASARKSLQSNAVSKDISQSHATNKSNDNKAPTSKLTLLPTPPVSSFPTSERVSINEVKKPLLPVPAVALLPEPKATEAKSSAVIHSEKLVSLQEKLKKTLESCGRSGGKKALTEEQVKDLEVNEMLILINTIMTKIIQDITKDRPSKFSVREVLDCGINQRGDLFLALEKLFGRDKPQQLAELVKALKSIDPKVLQGLKELLEKDQEPAKLNEEKGTCGPQASTAPRGISSAKVQKGNSDGLLNKPETSTDLKNGSFNQLGKVASGKYHTQSPREMRALLPTPRGALLPTPNASGPRFRHFF